MGLRPSGAKGHGSAVGCVERLWKKVLKFDGAFGPEGCGIALLGDEYKVSVTGFTFSIIWHSKHYGNQPPPVDFSPLWCLTAPPSPR